MGLRRKAAQDLRKLVTSKAQAKRRPQANIAQTRILDFVSLRKTLDIFDTKSPRDIAPTLCQRIKNYDDGRPEQPIVRPCRAFEWQTEKISLLINFLPGLRTRSKIAISSIGKYICPKPAPPTGQSNGCKLIHTSSNGQHAMATKHLGRRLTSMWLDLVVLRPYSSL